MEIYSDIEKTISANPNCTVASDSLRSIPFSNGIKNDTAMGILAYELKQKVVRESRRVERLVVMAEFSSSGFTQDY